jgi:hypothetical protein
MTAIDTRTSNTQKMENVLTLAKRCNCDHIANCKLILKTESAVTFLNNLEIVF